MIALALVMGWPSAPVRAATATAVMAVSATVLSLCTIITLPLAFGNYTSTANLDSTATITVTCTATTAFNISLDPGGATGATVTTRKMTFGSSLLNYSLFSNAARSINWGQTIGTDTVAGVGSGLPQVLTVYRRVPANQFASPGVYSDVITATITY